MVPAVLLLCLGLSACGQGAAGSAEATGISEIGGFVIRESESETAGTEEETQPEAPDTTEAKLIETELKLASFNIKHCAEGLDHVAAVIRAADADIIGLQEVDVNCDRSGGEDQPKRLAEAAGYPYYRFIHAIDLGKGEYGTAILSRYPILEFSVTPLKTDGFEGRALGEAVIEVPGNRLHVFCTHLSFEDRKVRQEQMKFLAERLKKRSDYALLADLNAFQIEDITLLEAAYYVSRADRLYESFRRAGVSPDNIVLSGAFTELDSGLIAESFSDHKLLWARVMFRPER